MKKLSIKKIAIIILFLSSSVFYSNFSRFSDKNVIENEIFNNFSNNNVNPTFDNKILELSSDPRNLNQKTSIILTIKDGGYYNILRYLENSDKFTVTEFYQSFSILEVSGALKDVLSLKNIELSNKIEGIFLNSEINTILSKDSFEIFKKNQPCSSSKFNSENDFVNFTSIIGYDQLDDYFNESSGKLRGENSVIAVLDSGIDGMTVFNEDLENSLGNFSNFYDFSQSNPYSSIQGNSNFTETEVVLNLLGAVSFIPYEPLYYTDLSGSGTYHAAIAGGLGRENVSFCGIAPNASILNVKVRDSLGLTYYSFVLSGLRWAVSHDSDVIMMPWSFPGSYDDPISKAINKIVEMGLIVVVPTGDDGPAYTSSFTPAQASKAITVGAYNSFTNDVANFSSRGPTFDMRQGTDILAPGVGIEGPSSLFSNDSLTIRNSSTISAAIVAGVCAVLISIFPTATPEMIKISLMKTAKSILPNSVPNSSPNSQGYGLLNITAAALFLERYLSSDLNFSTRSSQLAFYPGAIINADVYNRTESPTCPDDWDPYNLFAVTSTQAMMSALLVVNGTDSSKNITTDIHLPINQFGLSFNDTFITFSELDVYRELDMITSSYDPSFYTRYSGILGYKQLFIAVIIESWSYTYDSGPWDFIDFEDNYLPPLETDLDARIPAYRFSFHFINTGDDEFDNLTIYSLFKSDLYGNEYGINDVSDNYDPAGILNCSYDDEFYYNESNQIIYSQDQYTEGENATNEWTSIGFNSTTHKIHSWEINSMNEIFGSIFKQSAPDFSNSSSYDNESSEIDYAFGQSWIISENLGSHGYSNFSSIFALGKGINQSDSYNRMMKAFNRIQNNITHPTIEDIAIITTKTPRMSQIDEKLTSEVIIINLGNTYIPSSEIYFVANCTSTDEISDIYSKSFAINDFQPKAILKFSATWIFTEEGCYDVGWRIGGISDAWSAGDNAPNNNFQSRNVVVYDYSNLYIYLSELILLSPSRFPIEPFIVRYAGDIAFANFTIISPLPLGDCMITTTGSSNKILSFNKNKWISFNKTEIIELQMMVPLFFKKGSYLINFHLFTNHRSSHLIVPIQFTLQENLGRIMFDGIHNQFIPDFNMTNSDLGSTSNIANFGDFGDLEKGIQINSLFDERLDTIYGNYYDFHDIVSSFTPKGMAMTQIMSGLNFSELLGDQFDFGSFGNQNSDNSDNSETNDSMVFSRLFKGDNFFKFSGEVTTENYTYDLIKIFDALVITDPEIPFSDEEIFEFERFLNLGGKIFIFAENQSENDLVSINKILNLGGLNITGQNYGIEKISSNNNWPNSLSSQINYISLVDPMKISIIEGNWENAELINNYIASSSVGLGQIIVLGDDDLLTQKYINTEDNRNFVKNLFKYFLDSKFDFKTGLTENFIKTGEKTYITLELQNLEMASYLEEDFLTLVGFVDEYGNDINAKLYGFELPILPMLRINESNYIAEFDSMWLSSASISDVKIVIIVDSPIALSEAFTFDLEIGEQSNFEEFIPYKLKDPDYPLALEVIFVFLAIANIMVIWKYSTQKWKLRHRYVPMTGANKAKIDTFLSSFKILLRQIDHGIESDKFDEIEKVRFVLGNEKSLSKQIENIKDIASEMGEK